MQLPSAINYNVNFRNVWVGQILCQSANKAAMIDLLWWTLDRPGTTSSAAAWANGALLLANALPAVVLASFIGRALQARGSRVVIGVAQCVAAFGLAAMFGAAASKILTPGLAVALSSLVAAGQSCVDAGLNRSVCELVPRTELEQAVALEAATQPLASLGGTALGAIVAGLIGLTPVLALCAAGYLVAASLTLRSRFTAASDGDPANAAEGAAESSDDAWVGRLLHVFAAANFLLFPIFLVLPLFTRSTLRRTVTALGLLEAGFWCGLIAGTALAGRLPQGPAMLPRLVGAALLVFGAALAAMARFPSPAGTAAGLAIGGLAVGIVNVKVLGYFQQTVAEARKPAFFARLQAWIGAGQPLGYAAFALVLSRVEPATAFAVQGCGLLLLGAPLALARRTPG